MPDVRRQMPVPCLSAGNSVRFMEARCGNAKGVPAFHGDRRVSSSNGATSVQQLGGTGIGEGSAKWLLTNEHNVTGPAAVCGCSECRASRALFIANTFALRYDPRPRVHEYEHQNLAHGQGREVEAPRGVLFGRAQP